MKWTKYPSKRKPTLDKISHLFLLPFSQAFIHPIMLWILGPSLMCISCCRNILPNDSDEIITLKLTQNYQLWHGQGSQSII